MNNIKTNITNYVITTTDKREKKKNYCIYLTNKNEYQL